MNIMVAGTKGGVGKSAFAMQLIAPYLYERFGSAHLCEVDDHNYDSSDYKATRIACSSVRLEKGVARAVEYLDSKLFTDNVVIDIGGNETASTVIQQMGKSGSFNYLNAILVPVSQTGKDVENAGKTIRMVKENFEGFDGAIILGVTRVPANYDEVDIEQMMPDLFELASEEGVDGVITLPDSPAVPQSRGFGLTAWELATYSADHLKKIHASMRDEHRRGDDADMDYVKRLSRQSASIKHAVDLKPHLEERFQALDMFLGIESGDSAQPEKEVSVASKG